MISFSKLPINSHFSCSDGDQRSYGDVDSEDESPILRSARSKSGTQKSDVSSSQSNFFDSLQYADNNEPSHFREQRESTLLVCLGAPSCYLHGIFQNFLNFPSRTPMKTPLITPLIFSMDSIWAGRRSSLQPTRLRFYRLRLLQALIMTR